MKKKKIFKIIAIVLAIIIMISLCLFTYGYYKINGDTLVSKNKENYPNYIGYINPETSLLNKEYKLCDEGRIYGTHHGKPKVAFAVSKNHFRNSILSEYKSNNFKDSGYLNFRFLVNCEGHAGWFEITEMNLDLEETDLNDAMVNELLKLTSNSKHWTTFYLDEEPKNYYMYISYRIENGKITEILP